ncbi:Metallo-dependent phosphatase, partial [Pyrenochaeta sp. DS3sAY3a]
RKTRIVCISDTHNQTPKLPAGDVLIHAGDLTNQGSLSELQKTVRWLERADFEVKIVVAGNHDITLDPPFYTAHKDSWRWPNPQDPSACRDLLLSSPSITYLENETATIKLTSPNGPHTIFTVFGSPCTPKHWNWAFQYAPDAADDVWRHIPDGVDIVVTHTPPQGHCDSGASMGDDDRSGCPGLTKRLWETRPLLNVCGHIHSGRGVEKVRWAGHKAEGLVDHVEVWEDPGKGSKKMSLVDLSYRAKIGRGLGRGGGWSLRGFSDSMDVGVGGQPDAASTGLSLRAEKGGPGVQPQSGDAKSMSTSSLEDFALSQNEAAAQGARVEETVSGQGDIGIGHGDQAVCQMDGALGGNVGREETVVINAAYLGARAAGKAIGFNKPIVVDVELPV